MRNHSMTEKRRLRKAAVAGAGILCAVIALGAAPSIGGVKATEQKTTTVTPPSVAEARAETVYVKADSYRQELARRQEEAKARAEAARRKAEEEARQKAEEEKRRTEERKQSNETRRQHAVQKQSVTSKRRSSV